MTRWEEELAESNRLRRQFTVHDGAKAATEKSEKHGPVLNRKDPLAIARQMLAEKFERTLRHWRGDFLHWTGGAYRPMEDAAVRRTIYLYLEAAQVVPNARIVSDVAHALRAACYLPGDADPPAWLRAVSDAPDARAVVSVTNGVLDPSSRMLMEHSLNLFSLNVLPVTFALDAPAPQNWHRFLSDIWPDDHEAQETLQEFFGYALTADTSQQKILLIVGPKRSGKGTLARVLTGILGHANVSAPTLSSLSSNFGLAGEQFLEALAQDFAEHGRAAIVACREEKPTEYVKVVASLLPKELLVRKDPVDELSDKEIADALDILRGFVARDGERAH